LLNDLPQEMQILFFKYLAVQRKNELEQFMNSEIFDQVSDKVIEIIQVS
jgi:hypothetical protein